MADSAVEYFELALQKSQDTEDPKLINKIRASLVAQFFKEAQACEQEGDLLEAKRLYLKQLTEAQKMDDKLKIGGACCSVGKIYEKMAREAENGQTAFGGKEELLEGALLYSKKHLHIALELNDLQGQ